MSRVPPEPVVILTSSDARILWQAARLNELRLKHRTGDNRLYTLLVDIHQAALLGSRAGDGNEPRQLAASEERSSWTTEQLARVVRLAPRTVRLDIENQTLPATKRGGAWHISPDAAETYIASRRPS